MTAIDHEPASAQSDFRTPPPVGTTEHALWLAHWHFELENPDQLDMLQELYHDDIVWEVPARRVVYYGKDDVIANYRRMFESCAEPNLTKIERYGTPERVFDDSELTFKLIDGKGFPNHPLPVGTRISLRIVHNFHIQDGLIIREIGYEMWRPDISW